MNLSKNNKFNSNQLFFPFVFPVKIFKQYGFYVCFSKRYFWIIWTLLMIVFYLSSVNIFVWILLSCVTAWLRHHTYQTNSLKIKKWNNLFVWILQDIFIKIVIIYQLLNNHTVLWQKLLGSLEILYRYHNILNMRISKHFNTESRDYFYPSLRCHRIVYCSIKDLQ